MRYSAVSYYSDRYGKHKEYYPAKNIVNYLGIRTMKEVKHISGHEGTTEDGVDFYDKSDSKTRYYYLFVVPETSPIFNLYIMLDVYPVSLGPPSSVYPVGSPGANNYIPASTQNNIEKMFANTYSNPLIKKYA